MSQHSRNPDGVVVTAGTEPAPRPQTRDYPICHLPCPRTRKRMRRHIHAPAGHMNMRVDAISRGHPATHTHAATMGSLRCHTRKRRDSALTAAPPQGQSSGHSGHSTKSPNPLSSHPHKTLTAQRIQPNRPTRTHTHNTRTQVVPHAWACPFRVCVPTRLVAFHMCVRVHAHKKDYADAIWCARPQYVCDMRANACAHYAHDGGTGGWAAMHLYDSYCSGPERRVFVSAIP